MKSVLTGVFIAAFALPSVLLAEDTAVSLQTKQAAAILSPDAVQSDACAQPMLFHVHGEERVRMRATAEFYDDAPSNVARVIVRRGPGPDGSNLQTVPSETSPGFQRVDDNAQKFSVAGEVVTCSFGPSLQIVGGALQISGLIGNYRFDQTIALSPDLDAWVSFDSARVRLGTDVAQLYESIDEIRRPDLPVDLAGLASMGRINITIDQVMMDFTPVAGGAGAFQSSARIGIDFQVLRSVE